MTTRSKTVETFSRFEPSVARKVVYQCKLVCCGKRKCGRCRGVAYAHGPYWYAQWTVEGRKASRYVGKSGPESWHVGEDVVRLAAPAAREDLAQGRSYLLRGRKRTQVDKTGRRAGPRRRSS